MTRERKKKEPVIIAAPCGYDKELAGDYSGGLALYAMPGSGDVVRTLQEDEHLHSGGYYTLLNGNVWVYLHTKEGAYGYIPAEKLTKV